MKGFPALFMAALLLWLAAILDQSLAARLSILGAQPSFFLVVLGPMALLSRPRTGAAVGFAAGLMQGALAGANMTHYIISRSVAGFLTSLGTQLDIRIALSVAGLASAGTTLVAQFLLLFLAPPADSLVAFFFRSLGMSLYNGLLSIPLYALLRGWFAKPDPLG